MDDGLFSAFANLLRHILRKSFVLKLYLGPGKKKLIIVSLERAVDLSGIDP